MLLGSTVVLRRKFDPEECLRTIEAEKCDSLVVIPVMLQRMLALPEETRDRYDVPPLKVVACSGSALPGDMALNWMDNFGDNLYNIYGSTEVAYASIANPRDLREAPDSAGRPPYATVVKILDEDGKEVPHGESGRIFVGNGLLFEGYTGGGHKEVIDGLMSSGRRRPVRRRRPALRRGSRRRDDRLRRRERLPQGGRGLPASATTRSRRSRRSASTTTTTASGSRRSSSLRSGASADEDDLKA